MFKTLIFFFIVFLLQFSSRAFAQNANATYSVYITEYRMDGGGCWEGNKEEATFYVFLRDNVNTVETTSGCRTHEENEPFTWNFDDFLLSTRTNASDYFILRMYGWEDDNGDRCDLDGGDDCDCHHRDNINVSYRVDVLPSNGTFTSSGWNWCSGSDGWAFAYKYTWKYTGIASSITPTCTVQEITHNSGGIRSNSVYLTAGIQYRFETTAGPDTYLRLYEPNGYTIAAFNDDGGTGTLSLIDYTPTTTGTYYIENSKYSRNPLDLNSTLAYSIVPSTPASSINVTTALICSGSSTTLSVVGGSLNNGAVWKWYSGSCGGTYVGTGSSLNVSPSTTTTYYVRAEGGCNTTTCVSTTITVDQAPTVPTSITVSSGGNAICPGDSRTLTASGGSTGTSCSYQWYAGVCDSGIVLGTENSISVNPSNTTTYYVRRVGTSTCTNTTTCANTTITLNTESTPPASINADVHP
ncbi:MAG: hypothetical protein PHE33_12245 [Bacteroidales bacterium]|nr:hypothetical protein [Bacteroidales bacterium]